MSNELKPVSTYDNRPGWDLIPIDASMADVDLSDPEGVTGGYIARGLFISGEGNLVFQAPGVPNGPAAADRTIAVTDGFVMDWCHVKIVRSTSDCSGIFAII